MLVRHDNGFCRLPAARQPGGRTMPKLTSTFPTALGAKLLDRGGLLRVLAASLAASALTRPMLLGRGQRTGGSVAQLLHTHISETRSFRAKPNGSLAGADLEDDTEGRTCWQFRRLNTLEASCC